MTWRVLAAVDRGAGAERVLYSADAMARLMGGELHIRHVAEQVPRGRVAGDVLRVDQAELESLVARTAVSAASVRVLDGGPAEEVARAAAELNADMIVVGPHSGGDLGARVLGTTAERIVRAARVPCLVARGRLHTPLGPVVVPTDLSAPALEAARVAGRVAGRTNDGRTTEVHVLHVGWPPENLEDRAIEERALLPRLRPAEQAVADAADNGVVVSAHVIWSHDVADDIVDWSARLGAGLIVLGTAGAGGVQRMLLGSVAARVARHADVPVLLVPTKSEARQRERHRAPALARIVAGTDLGSGSAGALDWVSARFAPAAAVTPVHAVEAPDAPAWSTDGAVIRNGIIEREREAARTRFTQLFPGRSANDLAVRVGRAPDELAAAAREAGADLIAIGAHSHPRGLWSVLGTTAEQLIRTSPVPVLIVRGLPDGAPRRVLAAFDGSEAGDQVLAWAQLLADGFEAELLVAHVLNPRFTGAARMVSGMRAARDVEHEAQEQALAWLRQRVTDAGIDVSRSDLAVPTGDAAYELLALQQRWGADLMVLASRGAGTVGRAVIGSVSSAVVRGATCPVLVVRGDDPDVP